MLHPSVPCWHVWYFFVTSFRPLDGPKQKTFFFIHSLKWVPPVSRFGMSEFEIFSLAGPSLSFSLGEGQQCAFNADRSLCLGLPHHSLPGSLCTQVHEAANCILNPARPVQIRSYSQSAMVRLGNQGNSHIFSFLPIQPTLLITPCFLLR